VLVMNPSGWKFGRSAWTQPHTEGRGCSNQFIFALESGMGNKMNKLSLNLEDVSLLICDISLSTHHHHVFTIEATDFADGPFSNHIRRVHDSSQESG